MTRISSVLPSLRTGSHRSRRLTFEHLADRLLFAVDLPNPFNPLDVDDDGWVAPRDALLVIAELNDRSDAAVHAPSQPAPSYFTDTNSDGRLSPIDALYVINHLLRFQDSQPPIVLTLSPLDDPDGNGVVLKQDVTVSGQSLPRSRVRLLGPADSPQVIATDDAGRFEFPVLLDKGLNRLRITVVDEHQRSAVVETHIQHGDVILDWNAALLNVVRDWTTVSHDPYPNRIVTSPPPMVARNLAMMHAAMFDAVNAITQEYVPYRVPRLASPGTSPVAAAAAAAHRVASALYPETDERNVFDAALAEALATVSDQHAKQLGIDLGHSVGDAILDWRAQDGLNAAVPYLTNTSPGQWDRTYPDYLPPLLPQWPQLMPFAMATPSQFRPGPPPGLDSQTYADAVDEVMRLGRFGGSSRTADQTEIAMFWADGGGTFTPPGHWNQIAADVALDRGNSLSENSRLFAMLNVALADAGINSWDAKYAYNLWRPIDAIRKADTDGNPLTSPDPAWAPLLRTPPFPAYTSGHSTFSGAAAVVLSHIFGNQVAFSSRADGHAGFTQRPLAPGQVTTRSFESFSQAAEEASRSRIYGGIHYEFDGHAGLVAGEAIGTLVIDTHFLLRADSGPRGV